MINLTCNSRLAILGIILLIAAGCGGGGASDPVIPPGDNPPDNPVNPPVQPDGPPVGRQLWGMWDVDFNETDMTIDIEPIEKLDGYFTDVDTGLIDSSKSSLDAEVNFFDPVTRMLELNVTVKNPHEEIAYSLRAVVQTDDAGTEMHNPDGFTDTFDIPGGLDVNPFKTFAPGEPDNRVLPLEQYSENYQLFVPIADSEPISIAVEGSWYKDSEGDVFALKNFRHTEIYDDDTSLAEVYVDIEDPSGKIDSVTLEAPGVTGEPVTEMHKYAGDTYRTVVRNKDFSPVGDYECKVIAAASGVNVAIHSYEVIEVCKDHGWVSTFGGLGGGGEDSPVLGDRARDVAVDHLGNVYVTGMFNQTVDFDPGLGTQVRTSNGDYDIFLAKYDSGGNFIWVRTWGGFDGEFGDSIAIDETGDLYLVGRFYGTVDFDPGPGEDKHIATGKDAFLCMFHPNGDFKGAFTWGDTGDDYAYGISLDEYNNIYVTGVFEGMCDFDPGAGIDYHAANDGDVYVVKFDSNGWFQWARTWGANDWDFAEYVYSAPNGNILVTGAFGGTIDLDPGAGVDNETSKGNYDVFLAVLDQNGDYQWGFSIGGTGWDIGYTVVSDSTGAIYLSGDFQQTVDFDPSSGQYRVKVKDEPFGFISKYSANGAFLWVVTQGGVVIPNPPPSCEPILDMVVDPFDNLYAVGWYAGTVEFPEPGGGILTTNGGNDAFVSKFQTDGSCDWVRNIGGLNRDEGFGIDVDDRGNIYAAGFYFGTVDFNPGLGVTERTSNGLDDVWLIKLLPDGMW